MRISDWSSDVCSSDLRCGLAVAGRLGSGRAAAGAAVAGLLLVVLALAAQIEAEAAGIRLHAGLLQSPFEPARVTLQEIERLRALRRDDGAQCAVAGILQLHLDAAERGRVQFDADLVLAGGLGARSEEHTSELQSLMRISYAVFCLKK